MTSQPPTLPSGSADPPPDEEHRAGIVALVGRPNVGKSTLLNALLGEKVAIVSPKPQTTRRQILGIRTTDAVQVVFVDTPGIHKPQSTLGRSMVRAARGAIPDADVVVWVVDVSKPPEAMDLSIAGWIRQARRPVILAMNKSDRLQPPDVLTLTAAFRDLVDCRDWVLTIATEGHNLDLLWEMILPCLPPGPALYPADQLTDQTDRMMAAELVREAALRHLHEEVPHGVEVIVEDWDRRSNGVLHIGAKVLVERSAHKAIVIGADGAMLKRIGTDARRQIEKLLETRVYLELFVAVRDRWRDNPAIVRGLGFR